MSARSRTAVILAAGALASGCPNREEATPLIAVSPGVAGRMAMARRGGERKERAFARVAARGDLLSGPSAVGREGDLVLGNGEIVCVVDSLREGHGFAESGGNLVDCGDATTRVDELGVVFTFFGVFPRQGVYEAIDLGTDPDGSAWIRARGHDLYDPKLEVTTRYSLAATDRAVLVRTELVNRGAKPVADLSLGDAVQWGGVEKLAPGKEPGFRGPSKGAFVGGIGLEASYAITSTDGELEALSGGAWTDTFQRRGVTLGPGERVAYERVFVVGARPDSAALVAELSRAAGQAVGRLAVQLVDGQGAAVAPVASGMHGKTLGPWARARVILATPDGVDALSLVAARSRGELSIEGEVPPGKYLVRLAPSLGRSPLGSPVPVLVEAGGTARVVLPVSEAGALRFECVERRGAGEELVPCKATLEALEGAAVPDFGPAHVTGPAKRQILAADGGWEVPLAPGRYRVTLSRGPEYAAVRYDEVVAPGATVGRRTSLRRVVDRPGYLGCDLHQHTVRGADAAVSSRDRVVSNVVEGVDVAVASEHNVVSDLGAATREAGLSRWFVSVAGDEITSDASREPWGHANVFPLTVRAGAPRGGAAAVRDRSPRDVLREAARDPLGPIVQIDHPRSGRTGYFDAMGFDRARGVGAHPSYDPQFDALEVWNGRNVHAREVVLDDYFALLRSGRIVTPTANTDTHGVVGEEAGYPRTYVAMTQLPALDAWGPDASRALAESLRARRDVVLTNGPFVRVAAAGRSALGRALSRALAARVVVSVESAPHVRVTRLELRRVSDGRAVLVKTLTPRENARGALATTLALPLDASRDDAYVVVVSGTEPMRPVLDGPAEEIAPWAMSSAFAVDGDGDGRVFGATWAKDAP